MIFIHILYFPIRMCQFLYNKIRFKTIHYTTVVRKGVLLTPKYIQCGKGVYIGNNARIEGVERYNNVMFTPNIVFENNVSIQQNLHLTCANSVYIESDVAIAANVTITDIHHPYVDVNTPIEYQDIVVNPVRIKSGSKIYNNAVVLPGVIIGKHVTIGANSVVTRNIPDYSVAIGTPAIIIKRYCFESQAWKRTDPNGNFIN